MKGHVHHLERHAARLCRDARVLARAELDPARVRAELLALASRAPETEDQIVRLAVVCEPGGGLRLAGAISPLGPVARIFGWSTRSEPIPHPGPERWRGCKSGDRAFFEQALARARADGADEALLFDAEGRLVEGARSNLCAVLADGGLHTPPLARGAVAGIAREILLERVALLGERDLTRPELAGARELVAVNAVRGAVPITRLDGAAIGDGRPGPWARRLSDELQEEAAR